MSGEKDADTPALSAETVKILTSGSGQDAAQYAHLLGSFSRAKVYSSSESSEEEEEEEYEPFDYVAYYKEKFPERYQDVSDSTVSSPKALITVNDEYVQRLVVKAFTCRENTGWSVSTKKEKDEKYDYHWGEYEDIDWFSCDFESGKMVVSSYYNRKGLNRKGNLVHILSKWQKKYKDRSSIIPESFVLNVVSRKQDRGGNKPTMQDIEEAIYNSQFPGWPSEEDTDKERSLWIFKPSVTNRADGIRLISGKEDLVQALMNADELALAGGIVLQRYLQPLLINACKFHLRVFVVVVGNIEVYVSPDFLAIFSLQEYDANDLSKSRAHLTNIAYQDIQSMQDQQRCMRAFDETKQDMIKSGLVNNMKEAQEKINSVKQTVYDMVKETLHAVSSELTFQARTNCFEIFGFDFMISPDWNVWLLEANSQPDLAKAGDRLQPIIDKIIADTVTLTTDGNPRFPGNERNQVSLEKVFSKKAVA
mmetsp:Transcript_4680/g.6233  ORF Transcript_4680/g.6233 Transcript_4680/m.6233 type:complete len:478 (-) Transcript_4680:109-1542(-)